MPKVACALASFPRRGPPLTEEAVQVRCPNCNAFFLAEGEWRLAKCPKCSGIVMRMEEDSSYD